jgi:hypothetical protein
VNRSRVAVGTILTSIGLRTSALLSAADQLDEILQVQSLFDIFHRVCLNREEVHSGNFLSI